MVTKWATLVVGCAGIRQTNTSRHIVALHWVGIGHCNQSDKKQNPNLHSVFQQVFNRNLVKRLKMSQRRKKIVKMCLYLAKKQIPSI